MSQYHSFKIISPAIPKLIVSLLSVVEDQVGNESEPILEAFPIWKGQSKTKVMSVTITFDPYEKNTNF